jgi:hypothetical protein
MDVSCGFFSSDVARQCEPMSTEEQFLKDAREFGLELAEAMIGEAGAGINPEALQAHMSEMEAIFLKAIEHIAKHHGPVAAEIWEHEAHQAIQQRFAEFDQIAQHSTRSKH